MCKLKHYLRDNSHAIPKTLWRKYLFLYSLIESIYECIECDLKYCEIPGYVRDMAIKMKIANLEPNFIIITNGETND